MLLGPLFGMAMKGKYKPPSLEMQVETLKKVAECQSKSYIASEYDITKCTLFDLSEIFISWENVKFRKGRKRMRTAAHKDLEEALLLYL